MPVAHADRNLLFGILAVQMEFVSRDALISAMNAWVLAKSRPIGELLLEEGRLGQGSTRSSKPWSLSTWKSPAQNDALSAGTPQSKAVRS